MDNFGFSHAQFVETVLQGMLGDCGVRLISLCILQISTRELCFHQIKGFLQCRQLLAEHETKIAIADGVLEITPQ